MPVKLWGFLLACFVASHFASPLVSSLVAGGGVTTTFTILRSLRFGLMMRRHPRRLAPVLHSLRGRILVLLLVHQVVTVRPVRRHRTTLDRRHTARSRIDLSRSACSRINLSNTFRRFQHMEAVLYLQHTIRMPFDRGVLRVSYEGTKRDFNTGMLLNPPMLSLNCSRCACVHVGLIAFASVACFCIICNPFGQTLLNRCPEI